MSKPLEFWIFKDSDLHQVINWEDKESIYVIEKFVYDDLLKKYEVLELKYDDLQKKYEVLELKCDILNRGIGRVRYQAAKVEDDLQQMFQKIRIQRSKK